MNTTTRIVGAALGLALCVSGVVWLVPAAPRSAEVASEHVAPPPSDASVAPVVLLHGLGRSERAMRGLALRVEAAGLETRRIGYDSVSRPIDEIVEQVDAALRACCAAEPELHFVTHSLGGIVLRAWIAHGGDERVGRVVMLSPPNHGSRLVDALGEFSGVLGPTGSRLGTEPGSVPSELNALGPVDFELGVIAGRRSLNPLGSLLLEGPDDGTVSVASARVAGMRDFLVLPASHSFMVRDREVARQTVHFLQHGHFDVTGGEYTASQATLGEAAD